MTLFCCTGRASVMDKVARAEMIRVFKLVEGRSE
jgi:hypothetical protein